MPMEPRPLTVTPIQTAELRREFPKRDRQPILEELDEQGDVIFRFKLDPRADADTLTLREFYRESITDLLRIVRLFAGNKPVIIDGFAFLNAPHEPISLAAPVAHDDGTDVPKGS